MYAQDTTVVKLINNLSHHGNDHDKYKLLRNSPSIFAFLQCG